MVSFCPVPARIRRGISSAARLPLACRDFVARLRGAPDGLPIPPAKLHVLVSGDANLGVAEYFEIGRLCAGILGALLAREGSSLAEMESVLDFGCGCGRVLRQVRRLSRARLVGSDVNPASIQWCRDNLPIGEFHENGLAPPLGFRDASFDLVYSFSVFTHLPEPLQRPWLGELVRVLRPNGYLLLTTMGEAYAQALGDTERRQLKEHGIFVRGASSPGTNDCLVYHTVDYVKTNLTYGLELRQFEPGGMIDSRRKLAGQDAYLLRKPGPPV